MATAQNGRRQSARLVPVLAGYQVPSNGVTIKFAISFALTSEHAVETSLSRFLLSIRDDDAVQYTLTTTMYRSGIIGRKTNESLYVGRYVEMTLHKQASSD